MVKRLLQIEGSAIFLISLFVYQYLKGNWLLSILLLFTPDISMIGYLKDKKLGSITYNCVHNFTLALGFGSPDGTIFELLIGRRL